MNTTLFITEDNYKPDSAAMDVLQAAHPARPAPVTGITTPAEKPGEGLAFLRWPSDNATVRWEYDYQQAQVTA